MNSSWKDFLFPLLGQIFVIIAILGIALFIQQNPIRNVESFIDVVLAVSSIVFGFLTLTVTIHLEELREEKRDISNLAAELLGLLDKVRNNKKLSQKIIHYSTKYYDWGFEGTSGSSEAESTILMAYDYLLKNVRTIVHWSRQLILTWAIPGLALLFMSIILAILSKIIVIDSNFVGEMGLISIIFGVTITILGWWDSNGRLEKISDSIFNIRHTILGDLYRENSSVGYINFL